MDRELYMYECEACCLVFGVESAFEEQSDVVCPVCGGDKLEDTGTAIASIIREPEVEAG